MVGKLRADASRRRTHRRALASCASQAFLSASESGRSLASSSLNSEFFTPLFVVAQFTTVSFSYVSTECRGASNLVRTYNLKFEMRVRPPIRLEKCPIILDTCAEFSMEVHVRIRTCTRLNSRSFHAPEVRIEIDDVLAHSNGETAGCFETLLLHQRVQRGVHFTVTMFQ